MSRNPSRSSSHVDHRVRFAPGANDGDSKLRRSRFIESSADKATSAFVRRVLCAHQISAAGEKGRSTPKPIDELLPPLTSSNEVDLELYAYIAVVIKEFVSSWYGKITQDHVFTDEVIQIIAHCTRALEQRLRMVDLEALVLDELPKLVDDHIAAYRTAAKTAQLHSLATNTRQIYHTLQPHPALSPVPDASDARTIAEQKQNEATWRQLLVQGVLAVLLPTEDLENGCLRALVSEVFSEMILGNGICGRACENWLLWEAVINIVESAQTQSNSRLAKRGGGGSYETKGGSSRLEQFGLLSSKEELLKPLDAAAPSRGTAISVSALFWTVIQAAFLAFTALRTFAAMLVTSSTLPLRTDGTSSVEDDGLDWPNADGVAECNTTLTKVPIVSMGLWGMIAHVIELEQRMPWLSGLLALLHWGSVSSIGRIGCTDGKLDRILAHHVRSSVLDSSPQRIASALRAARQVVFPSNGLASPRATPDATEALAIKHRAAGAIVGAVPAWVWAIYFASRPGRGGSQVADWEGEVAAWLDVVGDPYLNKHLVVRIVELVVVRCVPEMGTSGVDALLAERVAAP